MKRSREQDVSSATASERDEAVVVTLQFQHLKLHAAGGLGEVFRAQEADTCRTVALKFIKDDFNWNDEVRRRFLLEAEITARLEHPGVVPVYGIGMSSGNRPFYAMRFIEGETLDDAIRRHHRGDRQTGVRTQEGAERSLEFRGLLQRFVSVCNTIAYAHNRGIVHRDIKPHNILLGRFGETLVVDWGLAMPTVRDEKARQSGEQTLQVTTKFGSSRSDDTGTTSGSGAGTPAYMSPEQANGSPSVGTASDVYSLGATLYKILTGQAPFRGDAFDVMQQVAQGDFLPPACVNSQVPEVLEAICLKAMAKDPATRYRTALELAADIEHYLADEAVSAFPERWTHKAARWGRRHRTAVLVLLLSLMVLTVGGIGVAVVFGRQAQRERVLYDQAVAAHQREHELRADSLRASAEFAANSIANQIDIRWRVLEKEADDPRLPEWLAAINEDPRNETLWTPLQSWFETACARYANIPARSWHINARDGTQVARFPAREENGVRFSSLGQRFAFRDYFHGRGHDFDDDVDVPRAPLAQEAHLSTVLESTNDGELTVIFTVPIRDPGTHEPIGVMAMSVELGEFADLKLRLPQGQKVLLVDTRQYYMHRRFPTPHRETGEGLVLHHADLPDLKALDPLPHIEPQLVALMRSAGSQRTSDPDAPPVDTLLPPNFRDPLTPNGEREWVAAFAEVVVKSRPEPLAQTGWFVIVEQQHSHADH